MEAIPAHIHTICLNDSQPFFSSKRSGTTVTKAMYINPPDVNGRIQAVLFPEV